MPHSVMSHFNQDTKTRTLTILYKTFNQLKSHSGMHQIEHPFIQRKETNMWSLYTVPTTTNVVSS